MMRGILIGWTRPIKKDPGKIVFFQALDKSGKKMDMTEKTRISTLVFSILMSYL